MKFFRDPLLHFLVIGALLFGVFNLASAGDEPAPGEIVVSAGQIASLAAIFSQTWQRPPTTEERDSLVADYVRDEIFYREAVAMGLDQDDAIIRRRMRQKMEFVADVMAEVDPTDDELKAYVAENPDRFRMEPRFSFSHVYFKLEGGGLGGAEAESLLQSLDAGTAKPEDIGDAFMPGFQFDDLARSDVAQIFGESFAAWIEKTDAGSWQGPASSAYGVHLVHVRERAEGREPAFEEIREAARREWLHARKVAANDALYEELRSRYVIRIEDAPEQPGEEALAEASL